MNQSEYIIAKFKSQVADLSEKLYLLDFKCILLNEENEKLKERIAELESRAETEKELEE